MNPDQKCPRCGQPLPTDAPAGHCPNCLVQLALEAVTVQTATPANVGVLPRTGVQAPSSAKSRVKYFGDYELIEEIARGGMGVVWKARQVSLNRPVALKMILAGQFASESDVKRFHAEAEAAANLQHPNIVAIHEVGQHDGQHYFSMDYVEGKNLAELVRDGPLPAGKAAALVKTIAEAIHYAHQRGTLHRDLKPSNVLMDSSDQPRITDFGLAKQMSGDGGLTQTGAVLGTPAYMPPEQAAGRNDQVGPASDVYSIGAMLYHLLTGGAPFVGETLAATLRKAMEEEAVAPSKMNAKTPPDLETICLKCLEKKPERRYANARGLAEELGRFLNHEPILAKPANPLRKAWSWALHNPWIITASASAVILGLVGLAYYLWQRTAFSEWRFSHPNHNPPFTAGWFESAVTWAWMPYLLCPAALAWFDLMARRHRGDPILCRHLAAYSVFGSLAVAFGIFLILKWAEATAWHLPGVSAWYAYRTMVLGSFAFSSVGMLVVWEAAREHFSAISGLASLEPPEPDRGTKLNWKTAPLTLLNEITALTGYPQVVWKIGPITIRREIAAWAWIFWFFTGIWLVNHGMWWMRIVLLGTILPWFTVLWLVTKGVIRLHWGIGIALIAGFPIVSIDGMWFNRRLALGLWIIGMAVGLLLVAFSRIRPKSESEDSASPEAGEASRPTSGLAQAFERFSFEVLRFLAAGASFVVFLALVIPSRDGSRDWLSVLAGVCCLPAAAWCMSLRRARPSSVILLGLILLFGGWIIFASPYAIPFTLPGKTP